MKLDQLLKCDACGVVVHESMDSRSESDQCGIAYSPRTSPGQFYPCEGRLVRANNDEAHESPGEN